ncbi:MAG: choice-of-anchor L domain-containing protein [Bacteroidota bacterium]
MIRKFIFCILIIITGALPVAGQLVVAGGYTPSQLVNSFLLGGGVSASNITYTGSNAARGYFNGSASNIGLGEGVILSTGKITDAPGPNSAGSTGENFGNPGDALLDAIVGDATIDAAILEFDFIPSSDSVKFKYVFASEEYPEFVGSTFNDVFGFFISGPGISGIKNIALIPGTITPVTINNVNAGSFSAYYFDNDNGNTVEYDGFTTVLTAMERVVPCSTYHIKMAIADVGDGSYDSAVFLEAKSFTSNLYTIQTNNLSVLGDDSTMFEGCGNVEVIITRSGSTTTADTAYISYSGTATIGVDYNSPPTKLAFSPGQSTNSFFITSYSDALFEFTETILITVNYITACSSVPMPTKNLYIRNYEPPQIIVSDDVSLICPENMTISVSASGGYNSFVYAWSNGSSNTSFDIFPISSVTYYVTITETCGGFTFVDSVKITMPDYYAVQIVASNDTLICPGQPVTLWASASAGIGDLQMQWVGLGSGTTYVVNPTTTTVYTFQVTDSCGIVTNENVTVNVHVVDADFSYYYETLKRINFTDLSVNAVTWHWKFGTGEESWYQHPQYTYPDTGIYMVTLIVENSTGCVDSIIKPIIIYPELHVYVPNAFTPNADGMNDFFFAIAPGAILHEMRIYDHWGELLFMSGDRYKYWDGTFKGNPAPMGVYAYILHFETPDRRKFDKAGTVTLIR